MLKNSWEIYTKDMKNIFKNWVSTVLIIGLIVLPSLYAWLNIAASWNPYDNTKHMPVSIVNEDKGGKINGEQINTGDMLVKKLHENDELDWKFYNREKAMSELEYGDVFAVIVIPSDFTQTLATVTDPNPQKATLEYYVNEKINSVAPKITNEGASTLVSQISRNFTGEVNKTIFQVFNKVGVAIEKDTPDIKKFEQFVFTLEKNLPNIHEKLKTTQGTAKEADEMLKKANKMIPEASKITSDGLKTVTTAITYVTEGQKVLEIIDDDIAKNISTMKDVTKKIDATVQGLQNVSIDTSGITSAKNTVNQQLSTSEESVQSLERSLIALKDFNKDNDVIIKGTNIDAAIKETRAINKQLEQAKSNINKIDESIATAKKRSKENTKELQAMMKRTSASINGFINDYETHFSSSIAKELKNAKGTLTEAETMLTNIQKSIPEATNLVKETSGYVNTANGDLKKAMAEYPVISAKIKDLAQKIRKAEGKISLDKVVKLLLHDPKSEMSFFEEPIKLKTHAVFPIKNYGTGMAPFYGVLSLWVGALLLASLLEVNVRSKKEYSIMQVYFGKIMTFWTIGLCQAFVMSMGTIFIIGVSPESKFFFVLFCMFCSFVFMTIVYTLTTVFGDVGKALSIVILVLQIAGAGGTYPVALLPKFFQIINPFLPFTYAIEMVREATGGIIWEKVFYDVLVLSVIVVLFLLLGARYKTRLNKALLNLMKKSRESGLFH